MLRTILIPYRNFRRCVACYDDYTLLDTIEYVARLANTISNGRHPNSWRDEGAVECWGSHPKAFVQIGLMCLDEALLRKITVLPDTVEKIVREGQDDEKWEKPLWVEWDRLRSDHRASLVQRGLANRASRRIFRQLGLENNPLRVKKRDEWLCDHDFPPLQDGSYRTIDELHRFMDERDMAELGDDEFPNHYDQFNWSERGEGSIGCWPNNNMPTTAVAANPLRASVGVRRRRVQDAPVARPCDGAVRTPRTPVQDCADAFQSMCESMSNPCGEDSEPDPVEDIEAEIESDLESYTPPPQRGGWVATDWRVAR
jgi:hypothetical protein